MTISHIFTQGFLSTKGAQEKSGGSSSETMVSMCLTFLVYQSKEFTIGQSLANDIKLYFRFLIYSWRDCSNRKFWSKSCNFLDWLWYFALTLHVCVCVLLAVGATDWDFLLRACMHRYFYIFYWLGWGWRGRGRGRDCREEGLIFHWKNKKQRKYNADCAVCRYTKGSSSWKWNSRGTFWNWYWILWNCVNRNSLPCISLLCVMYKLLIWNQKNC